MLKRILFNYLDSCLVQKQDIEKNLEILKSESLKISQVLNLLNSDKKTNYDSEYASLNLPRDKELREAVNKLVEQKKLLSPKVLVIIGIGGSNLGTQAVFQAIYGLYSNQYYRDTSALKVYFADTIEPSYTSSILKLVEQELISGNNIILNVISKSGTTTETVANFALFLDLLKKYKPENYKDYIVATTDKNSKLWDLAQKEKFSLLEIPKNVGGRYSVLSAVGLFPLKLIDIDTESLCQGAQDMLDICFNPDSVKNSVDNNPAISAAILFEHYKNHKNKINIHDSFIFLPNLFALGQWYRQLVGESLGKQLDLSGKEVFVGITPTVSVGSTDLHSVAQLYLGGPYDKFTSFISVGCFCLNKVDFSPARPECSSMLCKSEKNVSRDQAGLDINIPDLPELNKLVPEIQNKSVGDILGAIFTGTCNAYKNSGRPYVSIIFPEISEYYLGQFLQFKMLEVIYLAKLLNINPFDQPQVELYKVETRKLLK